MFRHNLILKKAMGEVGQITISDEKSGIKETFTSFYKFYRPQPHLIITLCTLASMLFF